MTNQTSDKTLLFKDKEAVIKVAEEESSQGSLLYYIWKCAKWLKLSILETRKVLKDSSVEV